MTNGDENRVYVHHEPVMVQEVLEFLAVGEGDAVVDATLGGGGHSRAILEKIGPTGHLIAMDRDADAIAQAEKLFENRIGKTVTLFHGSFSQVTEAVTAAGRENVRGILFDFGLASHHLAEEAGRGFAFQYDQPLDMRYSREPGAPTAAQLLAELDEAELARILWEYGEERRSRAVARAIVRERHKAPITTTRQLAEIVHRVLGPRRGGIDPATRTFQGLRIAVNKELEEIDLALAQVEDILEVGARLVAISYHSLEDRRVKQFLRTAARGCICPPRQPVCTCGHKATFRMITVRPIRPTEEEVDRNPRARSARLRCGERIEQ